MPLSSSSPGAIARRLAPFTLGLLLAWGTTAPLPGLAQEVRSLIPRVRVEPRPGTLLERWDCPPTSIRAALAAVPSKGLPELQGVASQLYLGARDTPVATPRAPALAEVAVKGRPLRVTFWGDSHLAANFFTDELLRLSGADPARVGSAIIPASMGHPGVRTMARATCVSEGWVQDSAHVVPQAAEQPGPALVSLVSATPGAEFFLDLRNAGWVPPWGAVQVMLEGPSAPLALAVGVNDGPLQRVQIAPESGPMVLEVSTGNVPVSRLRVRLLEGRVRVHGVGLPVDSGWQMQWDVLAYPGATVDGLAQAQLTPLRLWLPNAAPDVFVLGYGTNEGAADGFDEAAYRKTLETAVSRLRQMFPQAACLLLGPGDRGVTAAQQASGMDAQRYSRVHARINAVQADVASAAGCGFWSAQEAMGGPGSAAEWQRKEWMTPDLIHFTQLGYQLLAQDLHKRLNWPPKLR